MPGNSLKEKAMTNHYCPEHGAQLEEQEDKYVCAVCGYEERKQTTA